MIPALEALRPHHEELRKRLVRSCAAVALCSSAAWLFSDQLTAFCTWPLLAAAPGMGKLVYTKLTDPFIAYLKLGLLAGIAASFPYLLHQVWLFISPGLLAHERRLARRVMLWSTVLFLSGGLFAFFVVLPRALAFFLSYAGSNLQPMLKLSTYLGFVGRLVLAFGIAFEIPFLMVMAAAAGLVPKGRFRAKRNYFYIVIAVLAILLAGGDPASSVLLALPLFGLYEAGVLAVQVVTSTGEEA